MTGGAFGSCTDLHATWQTGEDVYGNPQVTFTSNVEGQEPVSVCLNPLKGALVNGEAPTISNGLLILEDLFGGGVVSEDGNTYTISFPGQEPQPLCLTPVKEVLDPLGVSVVTNGVAQLSDYLKITESEDGSTGTITNVLTGDSCTFLKTVDLPADVSVVGYDMSETPNPDGSVGYQFTITMSNGTTFPAGPVIDMDKFGSVTDNNDGTGTVTDAATGLPCTFVKAGALTYSALEGSSTLADGATPISERYITHDDGRGNVAVIDRNCPPITDDKSHAAYLLAFDNGCMERFIAQEHEILHGIDGSGEVDQQIEHRIGSSNRAGGDFSCPISAISSGLYSTNISSLDVEAGGLYSSNTSSRLGSTEGTANSQTSSIQSNLAEGQYSNVSTSQTSNNFGVKSSIIASQGSDIGAAGQGTGKPNDAAIIASKDSEIQPNAVSGASNFNGIFASQGSSVTSSVRGVVIGADRGVASNSGSMVLAGQLGNASDVDGISLSGGQATVGTSRTLAHGKALQDAVAFRGLTPIPAPSLPVGTTPFEIAVRAALVNQGLAA